MHALLKLRKRAQIEFFSSKKLLAVYIVVVVKAVEAEKEFSLKLE